MPKLFISHGTKDKPIARRLQQALDDRGLPAWIDERELRGGDDLPDELERNIQAARAFLLLVSPAAFESEWVSAELDLALEVRGTNPAYRIVALRLDGTRLGAFKKDLGKDPLYLELASTPNGITEAMPALLAALGEASPMAREAASQSQAGPEAQPLEDLVLTLTDLTMHQDAETGARRARARARLAYEPAERGASGAQSRQAWLLTAPIGPIEAGELAWYLEKWPIWPSTPYQERARQVERDLVEWGKLLYQAALPPSSTANVLAAWQGVDARAARRFSVDVDATPLDGASDEERRQTQEAATALLGLPWELLHDGDRFLFQGARPTRVRRRLPSERHYSRPLLDPPIRILLVSPRPEDEACGYIDHRAAALPLVDAVEQLGGLVALDILHPPTLPELRKALDRAQRDRRPYQVIHFDGHGVYDRHQGLGGLCFEAPDDLDRLHHRRHRTIYTDEIGPLLADHRIQLIVLAAYQAAQAGHVTDSVATALLRVGVASVVALSHSMLLVTARRFMELFYQVLAEGRRIGEAMLAAQRTLSDESVQVFGTARLRLHDSFVPVLYQEQDAPRLFSRIPAPSTREQMQIEQQTRLGALPPPPETGFIGRSRELLALERQLRGQRWVLIRGQGGEGKTALAVEYARWQVRSGQTRRAAFVSVEQHRSAEAVLDALGRQLVPAYSVAEYPDIDKALQPIERALREQTTLLILDNLESLLPRATDPEAPAALVETTADSLTAILALAARLHPLGETRLLLTSREALPAPFAADRQRHELHRLTREDAIALIEQTRSETGADALADAQREPVEGLIETIQGHARTLALLAPSLRTMGIEVTRERLTALMEDMERQHPGEREHSLYASVAPSLARLAPGVRERARVLGVFQGSRVEHRRAQP